MASGLATVDSIDITFDFRSDTPPGKDPDRYSATLRRYHQLLWSKPLPNGEPFDLEPTTSHYLHHRSQLGEFSLSSDAVIPTFSRQPQTAHLVEQIPTVEREEFLALSYTIGGMMLFPSDRVGNKMTINQARGCHPRIKDRFDLTVECIRRHYTGETSPLSEALARYRTFLNLFGGFAGYVDFFLLQDLVDENSSAVKFSMPFDDFTGSPVPATLEAYLDYREHTMAFIASRNQRIAQDTAGP